MIPFIRPVQDQDLDALLDLAGQTGFGLTTLPPERALLERRVQGSMQAFRQLVREAAGQHYLFVLEVDGRVVGTSGVASKTGGFEPFYAYQLDTEHFESATLGVSRDLAVLRVVAEHNGPGEVGSLFLSKDLQGRGLGGLLSRCRFLFMAEHRDLFDAEIVAELRGIIDGKGKSPFWDGVGAHFFGVDFHRADYQVLKGKRFIAELMPRHPIYVDLLPEAARRVIGQVHPHTAPALRVLEREGFASNGLVDLFEAGPVVGAARDRIRTVRESARAEVTGVSPSTGAGRSAYLANTELSGFRACMGTVEASAPGTARLPQEVLNALKLQPGDAVRYVLREER